ncbi:MAG TPA: methylamine dehydrogenase light chain [Myxococcota bacterium]|nr:methylamine dehydrogenase light chain [Myxococcota bacterium]
MTNALDRWFARRARRLALGTSRRHFLARVGAALLGGAALPLLPVARAAFATRERAPGEPDPATPEGDPANCGYWRHCAIDGFLASCCGGSHTACPPGTQMSPVTWLGTCRNPTDGRDYVISYNDCCGKSLCGRCYCRRNEGDRPVYYASKSNDVDWCMGTAGVVYNSTVAIVVGVATSETAR